MDKIFFLTFIFLLSCSHKENGKTLTDEPEAYSVNKPYKEVNSYQEALQGWKTPEDLNDWIGARFKYDMQRALALSETQKLKTDALPIYQPVEFFSKPTGVCVDLSRFAFETLQKVSPEF